MTADDDAPTRDDSDPFVLMSQVDDPVLAARISAAARRRARELLDERPFDPTTLAKIMATLGPVTVQRDVPRGERQYDTP